MKLTPSQAGSLGGAVTKAKIAKEYAERIAEYLDNPIVCAKSDCSNAISYKARKTSKYCSRSCSASVNNFKNPKRTAAPKPITRSEITETKFQLGILTNRSTLKRKLVSIYGHKCSICLNTEWCGKPIPIELDHINGNAGDNQPRNLRLLCPNCHSQTPTAKGKNKGNGRKSRNLPLN